MKKNTRGVNKSRGSLILKRTTFLRHVMASVEATTQTATSTGNQSVLVRPGGEENTLQVPVTPPLPEYNQDFVIEIPAIFNIAAVTTYSRPCSPEVSPAFLPVDEV